MFLFILLLIVVKIVKYQVATEKKQQVNLS